MGIKKRLTTGLAACAIAVSVGATAALADSITYTVGTPTTTTDWTSTLTIPLFNSAGTLQSINFALAGDVLGLLHLQNTGSSSATVTSTLTSGLHVTGPGGLDLSTTASTSQTNTLGGGGSGSFSPPMGSSGPVTQTISGSSNLASYVGTGSLPLPISSTGNCTTTGSGNVTSDCSVESSGTLTVTENFVPEPASIALIGFGLAALGVRRRKRA